MSGKEEAGKGSRLIEAPSGEAEPEASISTRLLLRIIVLLMAVWNLVAGTMMTAFHGASSSAMGAGVADPAGQRLAGVHLVLLAPVYLLIAWKPDRYGGLIWLPFFGQVVLAAAIGYSILADETSFSDGILPIAVSLILGGLFGFVWATQQRTLARARIDAEEQQNLADLGQVASDEGGDDLGGQRC